MDKTYDDQAERAVLNCCLNSEPARKRAREALARDDFYPVPHEQIWVVMEELDAQQKPVDPVTVATALADKPNARQALIQVMSELAVPEHVGDYAEVVRGWTIRRRVSEIATGLRQDSMNLNADPVMLMASTIAQLRELRDSGVTNDTQTRLLYDLLQEPDTKTEWAVNGLLEKRDRIILTGSEGAGKSFLARQLGIFAAAGIQPLLLDKIEPIKVHILDYENSWSQIRRGSRLMYDWACKHGEDPRSRIHVVSLPRIDITRDRDLARIHREMDVSEPDLVIVGPLYRLTGRAIQTDDEAAPILAALDTLRERGASLVIEAHAGHSKDSDGQRDLRPRGSSALLGWPEFGYGLRKSKDRDDQVKMVAWRGDRSERGWPKVLRRSADSSTHWVPDLAAEVA